MDRTMPLPKFGTIAADEVLTAHAIYSDAISDADISSSATVSWKKLLNSKRWQTLAWSPEITCGLDDRVTFKEFIRRMFPQANGMQLKAMIRYAPSHS